MTTRSVDFRSDTTTRPTPEMRHAIASAPVGDACFGDDPTVRQLEATIADRLGKRWAIYVPTGTMSNQMALAAHTRPGDAVLAHLRAHIIRWEGANAAAHAGVQLVGVEAVDGLPTVDALSAAVYPDHNKAPHTALLSLENTHNGCGGIAHGPLALSARCAWARSIGLGTHVDGARLFNAAAALSVDVAELAGPFDTVSVCFSKGLGAPVGSALAGDAPELFAQADRARHRLGGGWRQAGMMAAGALFALEHHVDRLVDDHRRAALLASTLAEAGIATPTHEVQTNIVFARFAPALGSAPEIATRLGAAGVHCHATAADVCRFVTHLDIDDDDLAYALGVLRAL